MNLVLVAPETIARMHRHIGGRTDEALNSCFGISYNTWRKLAAGQPVRASVASRLIVRLSMLESNAKHPAND
ncbi:hypothetical protein KK488_07540 [Sphingobium sp. H33]|uniref:Uncharacterized protein n=2 Tax=Sphingobium nicotianae TaxID=2782607 RepID=A0A9X1DBB8_9SPHN|nr:hypothetical protein [Sphingobium nicotianae]